MAGYPGNYPQPVYGQPSPYPPPQSYPSQPYPPAPSFAPQPYPPQPAYAPQPSYAPQPYAPPPGAPYGYPAQPQAYAPPPPYAPQAYAAPPSPVAAPYAMAPAYAPAPVAVVAPSPYPMYAAVPAAPGMNYVFQFKAVHLDRHDVFSKSDPFLVIYASRFPGNYLSKRQQRQEKHSTVRVKKFGEHQKNWLTVHRTETVKNCQHPTWQPFMVNLYSLCGGNLDAPIKVEVWDSDHYTNHDFIGSAVTSVRDLTGNREVRLCNKRRIGIFNTSGRLEVIRCSPA